jgi:DNA-binding winged helix-turn-helix (wHTH) protein/tetratricopeptide (TPR) repeat protein
MEPSRYFFFPPFRLDLVNEQLWRDAELLPLRPKTFAVLRHLVEHPGVLVTKEELLKAVWPDTRGAENLPKKSIYELREIFRDNPKSPRLIETMTRRGWRFIAPLTTTQPVQSSKFKVQSSDTQDSALSTQHSVLVGREAELAQLHQWLAKATNGERQLVFVTGEPGIGKTAVVDAFLSGIGQWATGNRRHGSTDLPQLPPDARPLMPNARSPIPDARSPLPSPWIARGQCVEHHGAGEAYLPLLEALGRLCRTVGGESLIGLLRRHAPTWLLQMPALLEDTELEELQRKVLGAAQERMVREMAEAVEALTAERPLVLWLEDLQWSDYSTLDLILYLAQRREPARLLLIGTYRPADVIVSGHPLKAVKQELQAHGQCAELPLRFLAEKDVADYLAVKFSVGARRAAPLQQLVRLIHQTTEGNPLFMVTMVDYLVAQGVIVEEAGQWRAQIRLESVMKEVPDSLRQLIEKQFERLAADEQRVLETASVVGSEFSTVAVAAGLAEPEERVEEWCERLARRGHFLAARGTERLPHGKVTGRYNFLHALYQKVLYERLAAARRIRLHGQIAEGEEVVYGDQVGTIAAELAMHFERGQDYWRAVHYLEQAAQNALRRSANREAIDLLTKELALLKTLPDTPQRNQQELLVQITLAVPLMMTKGYTAPEVKTAYARARELARETEETPQLFPLLYGLSRFSYGRNVSQSANELREQMLRLAHSTQEPSLLLVTHMNMGGNLFFQGEFSQAHAHARQGLSLYDPRQHRTLIFLYGDDPQVLCLCWAALALWYLGYPDQALERISQALRIAQDLAHPFGLAFALFWTAFLHQARGEVQKVQEQTDALMALTQEHEIPQFAAMGAIVRSWAQAEQGHEEGIAQLRQGIERLRATRQELGRPYFLALLAEAYGKRGQVEEEMQVLTEALEITDKTGECMHQAELWRLKGELTLAQSSVQGLASSVKKSGKSKVKSGKLHIPSTQHLAPKRRSLLLQSR